MKAYSIKFKDKLNFGAERIMKRVVVTGAAGFIGSNFAKYLLQSHSDVKIICIDSLTYAGNLENLKDVIKDSCLIFYKADILNKRDILEIFGRENPDTVINFAAESHVDRSIKYPEIFMNTNVLGVQNLLEVCREYPVDRFHQISTDEVYGDLTINSCGKLFNEKSLLVPSGVYSASKASADLLALSYHRTYGIPVSISRGANTYGPNQYPEKLIPSMIYKALKDDKLPLYGKGINVRDWISVGDHCRGIEAAVEKGRAGEIYNIGCNCEIDNISLVKKLLDILGKPYSLIEFVEDRKGHDLRYAMDSTKLRYETGWKAQDDFDKTFEKTVKWYKDNLNWSEKIFSGEYLKLYKTDYSEYVESV